MIPLLECVAFRIRAAASRSNLLKVVPWLTICFFMCSRNALFCSSSFFRPAYTVAKEPKWTQIHISHAVQAFALPCCVSEALLSLQIVVCSMELNVVLGWMSLHTRFGRIWVSISPWILLISFKFVSILCFFISLSPSNLCMDLSRSCTNMVHCTLFHLGYTDWESIRKWTQQAQYTLGNLVLNQKTMKYAFDTSMVQLAWHQRVQNSNCVCDSRLTWTTNGLLSLVGNPLLISLGNGLSHLLMQQDRNGHQFHRDLLTEIRRLMNFGSLFMSWEILLSSSSAMSNWPSSTPPRFTKTREWMRE